MFEYLCLAGRGSSLRYTATRQRIVDHFAGHRSSEFRSWPNPAVGPSCRGTVGKLYILEQSGTPPTAGIDPRQLLTSLA